MPVAPLLQRFVEDELARASLLGEQACAGAVEALSHPAGSELPVEQVQARREAAVALKERAGAFAAAFRGALSSVVRAALEDASAHTQNAASGQTGGLSLMDESLVEADIEISRATMQIDSLVEWEQRELQTFTSALRGEAHVGESSNPIRPALVARALWQASEALGVSPAAQVQALRATAGAIGEPLKRAFAAACTRLEAQGITPSQYRTMVAPPGSALDAATQPRQARTTGALHALLARQPSLAQGSGLAAGAFGLRGAVVGPAGAGAIGVGGAVGAGSSGGATAHGDAAVGAGMPGSGGPATQGVDPKLVELIARLYDTLLADPGLAAPARGAVARLQASALRVALRDTSVLDGAEHPTWRLLDRIANACSQAAAAGPARLAAMAARCDRLADELARHAAPDAALHRQGLARLEALAAEDLREAQQAAAGAIGALQRTERRRHVQAQLQQRLEEQFVRYPVGPATRHWLRGASAQQIAEVMLQEGPDSAAAMALTRIVDDLLWSLHPPAHPASRNRLVKLLPGLIGRLRASMAQTGVSPVEQQAVLAELEASHRAVLWPTASAPEETPEEIVRRLREEVVEADDDGPRREFGNSVLDLSTLDTVPADLMPAEGGTLADGERFERDRRAQGAVAALAPGHAVRMLLQGHWHRAQLLWRSADAELLLFADDAGLTHALTRRALERLHAEGLAALDPPRSMVQRAIEVLVESAASAQR